MSLHPSVGNWGLPSGSHYVVRRNQVQWAPRWTPERIEAGRHNDRLALDDYYSEHEGARPERGAPPPAGHEVCYVACVNICLARRGSGDQLAA